jgi:CheY-like chemotaxis protein/nitrogen-specific signal transduction histidine kinase
LKQQYGQILERESEILQKKEEAEAATKAESEFLANMSHEIRTPATAMLGFAEILAEANPFTDRPERRVHAIETIRRTGEHLLEIIDRVLDRARLKAGRLEIERIPFSPTALVEEVLGVMRPHADAKGLALEFEVDSATPAGVESDATRIRQILMNLVSNAIKFTEAGSVRVSLGYSARADRSMLQFDVTDTGIGMSAAQIDRVFEPFTQVHPTGSHDARGAGLGLTISKGLTALLDGMIQIESKPGKGSTFRVSVPCVPVDRRHLSQEQRIPSTLERTMAETSERIGPLLRLRVLVAEDNRDNQRLLTELLRAAGIESEFADNGAIAVERVGEAARGGRRFDAIIMDMQMPVLSGHEAARRLRAMGYAGLIIGLTAHTTSRDRQDCLDAGCDEYLTKPIDRRRLVEILTGYANQAR